MLTPQSRELAEEFLSWLKQERFYTIKLFKMWSLVEDALEKQWVEEGFAEGHTARWLALTAQNRKGLEHLLNIMDFGGDYGVDFESLARMELFKKWAATRKRSTQQN